MLFADAKAVAAVPSPNCQLYCSGPLSGSVATAVNVTGAAAVAGDAGLAVIEVICGGWFTGVMPAPVENTNDVAAMPLPATSRMPPAVSSTTYVVSAASRVRGTTLITP